MRIPETMVNLREIRRSLGLTQQAFWSRIGVTQSGGSRYENGRSMPRPVRELLRLVHVERVDLSQVRKEDLEILAHLKDAHPDFHQDLLREVRATQVQRRPEGPAHVGAALAGV